NWFSTQKEVFKETNIIICVFDILNSLEQIISILIKTIKICKEKCLNDYTIIILLHKIDLVNLSYVHQKSKSILEFLKTHYEIFEKIHLYRTSIAKAFFFSSYNIILKIIEKLFKKNIAPISKDEYNKLEIEFRILLMFDNNLKYNIKELSHKFNIGSELALYHLKRLEMFGLIELLEDETIFMLTTRSDYIKEGIMKEQEAFRENKINLASKLFYTFMNLAEKAV
ncbi:MAG: hypothetical protein GF317_24100, partial [Candidatus Lokiarchaeota archaeon]|nr:hypothetical protein [Candidatus Lokiarchaeota archaeon]MBD3202456.1 hypothetical protein [Candidatus Lokiarchaeota archaeon]